MAEYRFANNQFYPHSEYQLYAAAGCWPVNGIDVSIDVRNSFAGTFPPGKTVGTDKDGMPVWVDLPQPTMDERIASIESVRASLLSYADTVSADWRTELALDEISDSDRKKLSAWMAYKREVKAISTANAITPGFEWPAIPAQ